MLTFLRRIRKSLLEEGSARKYFLYAIGEIVLVVIGILIALQINNWNESRKDDKVVKQYMSNLLIDLRKDKDDLQKSTEFGPIPVQYNDSLFLELQKRQLQGREKRIYHFLLLYTNEIDIYYHDRIISQLRNSGGFGLIRDQGISDAILDYDIHMRETKRYIESSRVNHHVNSEILHHRKIFELYRIEHLKDSAIILKNEIEKVSYPDDLKLLSYDELDIKIALNSLSSIRTIDNYKYQRAVQALHLNERLDSLIRDGYSFD